MSKPLRGDRNQCAACGNYFNSTAAFDKHRVGEFGKDRGCMGWFEMAHVGRHYGADGFGRGSKRLDSFFSPADQIAAQRITAAGCASNRAEFCAVEPVA